MVDNEKKTKFIELRAKGYSYDRISNELNVSKPTLISWSKDFETEIANLKAIELESLREQFYCTKQKRIEILGKQLQSIADELEKRDFSNIPTDKLMELLMKILNQIKQEDEQIIFLEKDCFETMKSKWEG